MAKGQKKIKRYNRIYGGRSVLSKVMGVVLTVVILAGFACLGWALYEPVSQFLSGTMQIPEEEPQESLSESQSSVPEQLPEEKPPAVLLELSQVRGAYLPLSALQDPLFLSQTLDDLKAQGINAILIDGKNAQGQVLYRSANQTVAEVSAQIPGAVDLNQVTTLAKAKDMIVIARIYAFRDPICPLVNKKAAVKYQNTEMLWLDNSREYGGKSWLNPYSELAQMYIADLSLECIRSGCTAVMLDGVQFPSGYSLDLAGYGVQTKTRQRVLSDFVQDMEELLQENGGVLLYGSPGTGKTLLAKATAGEAGVPFFTISGSDFVEMFVGVGASRVRDLFSEAKKHSPCIVFIDEIDAIGKSRDSRYGGGNDEREQTLNQLLAEMDGFDSHTACLVLGATNRPEVLDPALLRPGRFDRRIIVDRPDLKGRVDILKVHAKNVNMDETVDLDEIALATSGAVGSDLANMINEAAILAVKNKRKAVAQKDLFEAVEVVLVGKEKKDRIMSKEERRIVSYHEVGHALVSALQKDSEPVQKITIVPRTMGALGYVMQVPEEEKYLNTKKEIDAMLVGYLAGRAAEELVFETVTTGASNDIEKATRLARAMVTQYGMSEKFGLMGLETKENEYLTGRTIMNCGDATAAEVDQEVMKILKNSYEEAKRLLSENRDVMDKIAEFLIQKETITGKEFMKIFREAKGIPEPEEEETKEKASGNMDKEAEPAKNTESKAEEETQAGLGDAEEREDTGRDGTAEEEKADEQKPPVVIVRERR